MFCKNIFKFLALNAFVNWSCNILSKPLTAHQASKFITIQDQLTNSRYNTRVTQLPGWHFRSADLPTTSPTFPWALWPTSQPRVCLFISLPVIKFILLQIIYLNEWELWQLWCKSTFRVETITVVLFKGGALVNRWMRHLKLWSSHPLLLLPPTPSPCGFLSSHSLTCCSHSEAQCGGCTYTHQHV